MAGDGGSDPGGVPHAMLLGPDGTILARGPYGDALYAKLAEVMP